MRNLRPAARKSTFATLVTLLSCALAFPRSSFAAGTDDDAVRNARELFRQAMDDQDARHYEQALDKLRRVAAVKTTPAVQFYISYNEDKLGRLAVAVSDMRAALDELNQLVDDTTGQASADAAKLATFAKNELASLEPRVPHLVVQMDKHVDATLTVDDAPIASSLWTSVPVDPGTHHLVARARGRADDARDVTLAEGQTVTVSFATPGADQANAANQAEMEAKRDESRQRARTLGFVALGGAVLLVGGGIASYAVAGGDASRAQTRCETSVTCDPSRGAIRTFDTLALSAWIGSLALGGVAIVSFVRAGHDSAHESNRDAAPHASLLLGPGRAGIEGTF